MVSLLICTVGIPAILYVLLWISPVREEIGRIAEKELSELFGAGVSIGSVEIEPFSRLNINNVEISDSLTGRSILSVHKLGGGINPLQFIATGRFVVSDVEILEPKINLWRDSLGAPLNIDPILKRLKSDKPKEESARFSLSLHTAVVRRGSVSYHVFSQPTPENGCFSPHHISLNDIKANLTLPRISESDLNINLKRLSLTESSGLRLRNLKASVNMTDSLLLISGLAIEFPVSKIEFANIKVDYRNSTGIFQALNDEVHTLSIVEGSSIYPPDFAPINRALASINTKIAVQAKVSGTLSAIKLERLNLEADNRLLALSVRGTLSNALRQDSIEAEANPLAIKVESKHIPEILNAFHPLPSAATRIIEAMGQTSITGNAELSALDNAVDIQAVVTTEIGILDIDASASAKSRIINVDGTIKASDVNLAAIANSPKLGKTDFDLSIKGSRSNSGKIETADATLNIGRIELNGHTFNDVASEIHISDQNLDAMVEIVDDAAGIYAEASTIGYDLNDIRLSASIDHTDFNALGLWDKYLGYELSAQIDADLKALSANNIKGKLLIDNLRFNNEQDHQGIDVGPIQILADENMKSEPRISLTSDVVIAELNGKYNFSSLVGNLYDMIRGEAEPTSQPGQPENNFNFKASILENVELFSFFNLPVMPIYTVDLVGGVHPDKAWLMVNAPYLQKGDKLIRNSQINLIASAQSSLLASTIFPTKDGDATITLSSRLDHIDYSSSLIKWDIDRQKAYNGSIGFDAILLTDDESSAINGGMITFNRSNMVFNDSVWTIEPATISIKKNAITVNDLHIGREYQSVDINGVASADSLSQLDVALRNVNLDYLFETLNLGEAIVFGGSATGNVNGTALLSDSPILRTDNLHVDRFSYNRGLIGDADITARWDNPNKAIVMHADVAQDNGCTTRVDGLIAPSNPGKLEFTFYADHTPVTFLKNLLYTFTSDVTGEASGILELYGTMKNVQLKGALKPHGFGMTIAQTNCTYFTEDSVIITPGTISLSGITIRDSWGHTARLNGNVRHNYLKDSTFDININDVRNLIVYNQGANDDTNWYGRIFGTGSARLTGGTGIINVSANITTATGSEFTFTLSDREQAGEYSFLEFRDRESMRPQDTHTLKPGSPELDRIMANRVRHTSAIATATTFNMDLDINVRPNARMNLIMDPVSGDRITAYGAGSPKIIYRSSNDDFQMFGDYTIERGDYNFTLQDIIIKNFSIESGSQVNFRGDLDKINLDIHAIYSLKANLSDLDESFLNDKEVGRTSVTVQAMLNLDGPVTSPNIKFDLRFPTLTSDVDRKVHAIVSTEEMMNRQIIYLLALNKFYTPDYMTASSGKGGNELVSVASSTISSQLSNILGQISDKFTLAPNLRSDNGDFSDVEFDLALSSTLLNNRLLLNGNFGYRDQILNNNQFIGDFDIEYLLNRGGNWRLKAYNHFNDRNLYVKTAMTTQGIGIVFKHDFDKFINFFKGRKKRIAHESVVTEAGSESGHHVSEESQRSDSVATPQNR